MTCVKIEVKSQRRYAQSQLNSSCPQTNNKIYIKTWVKYFTQCVKSVCVLCYDVLYTCLRIQYIWLLQMNLFFCCYFTLEYAFTSWRQQKHICAIWRCDCHNNALNGLQCTSAVGLKIYFSNHQLFHLSTVTFSSQMSSPEQNAHPAFWFIWTWRRPCAHSPGSVGPGRYPAVGCHPEWRRNEADEGIRTKCSCTWNLL